MNKKVGIEDALELMIELCVRTGILTEQEVSDAYNSENHKQMIALLESKLPENERNSPLNQQFLELLESLEQ